MCTNFSHSIFYNCLAFLKNFTYMNVSDILCLAYNSAICIENEAGRHGNPFKQLNIEQENS